MSLCQQHIAKPIWDHCLRAQAHYFWFKSKSTPLHHKCSNHLPLCWKNTAPKILGWDGEGSWWNQICFFCFSFQFGCSALSHSLWYLLQQLVWMTLTTAGEDRAQQPRHFLTALSQQASDKQQVFFILFYFYFFIFILKTHRAGNVAQNLPSTYKHTSTKINNNNNIHKNKGLCFSIYPLI